MVACRTRERGQTLLHATTRIRGAVLTVKVTPMMSREPRSPSHRRGLVCKGCKVRGRQTGSIRGRRRGRGDAYVWSPDLVGLLDNSDWLLLLFVGRHLDGQRIGGRVVRG